MDDASAMERLRERAGDSSCSVCGASDWEPVKEGRAITFLSFAPKEDPRVEVLALACRNCGYLRFHSLEALRR